jgi:hypothetical protein
MQSSRVLKLQPLCHGPRMSTECCSTKGCQRIAARFGIDFSSAVVATELGSGNPVSLARSARRKLLSGGTSRGFELFSFSGASIQGGANTDQTPGLSGVFLQRALRLIPAVPAENLESIEKTGDLARGPVMSPACSYSSRRCSPGSPAGFANARNWNWSSSRSVTSSLCCGANRQAASAIVLHRSDAVGLALRAVAALP